MLKEDPETPIALQPEEVLIQIMQLQRGYRLVQHGGHGENFTTAIDPYAVEEEEEEVDAAKEVEQFEEGSFRAPDRKM